MPNMSDKNFPHAHGSGRVVAAFQLSHPAAEEWDIDEQFAPGAIDMQVLPPVLHDPSLAALFPYPSTGGNGFAPYRQPYNATSVGVYVQGSGTRRLPYTETLLNEVDSSLSVPINAKIPSTDLYPFELVDETLLGRTHAQVVCAAIGNPASGCGGPAEDIQQAGFTAYYEVGLNWDLPDVKVSFSGPAGAALNYANQKLASVQRALERTYWATASFNTNALAEYHPAFDYGFFNVDQMNAQYGPMDGAISIPQSPDFSLPNTGGCTAPYGWIPANGEFSTVQPAYYPMGQQTDNEFKTRPYGLQATVSAIVRSYQSSFDGAAFSLVAKLAPIVRIWMMLPSSPSQTQPFDYWAPRPIPRLGIGAYLYNSGFAPNGTSMVPGVNVQVLQKNTSAIDNTDLGIYDIGSAWSDIQNPPSQQRKDAPQGSSDPRLDLLRSAAKLREDD